MLTRRSSMNWVTGVLLLAVAGLSFPFTSSARTVALPCLVTSDAKGSLLAQAGDLKTEAATLTILENEEIVFAEFFFQDELQVGTEIELWIQVEGETPPWELPEGSTPFDRNFWITDERTGSLVRFDVTPIVRAWEAESLPNLGFVLRITNADELDGQSASTGVGPSLALAKEATLVYHIQPVRQPKEAPPVIDDGRPRKVPDGERDGGGRE